MESGDASSVDLLSILPEFLILYILSFLPIKFAVATTTLSKGWRFRWTQLTSFDFHDEFWRRDEGFVECVNMVLHHHRIAESISKFSLKCHRHPFHSVHLNTWIDTAIARNVQVFELSLCHVGFPRELRYRLTSALYTCGTLEVLKLAGPIVIQVPNTFCLAKLTSLELNSVEFGSDDCIDKLVSSCPALQSLKIIRYHYHDTLLVCCISSRTLKCLEIRFYRGGDCSLPRQVGIRELKVKIDAPALESLVLLDDMVSEFVIQGVLTSVNQVELDLKNGESIIVDLAEAFNRVVSLTLSKRTMNAICEAPTRLLTSFERLAKLVVEFDKTQWSCLLDLIDRCINLEVLDIRKVPRMRERVKEILDPRKVNWDWEKPTWSDASISVPRCFMSTLKRVSFRGLIGEEEEMSMLGYILEHCLLIQRVALWYGSGTPIPAKDPGWGADTPVPISEEKRNDIMDAASMLFRASPACEVSLSGWWDQDGLVTSNLPEGEETLVGLGQFCCLIKRQNVRAG